jgi:hypothetical protein
MERRLKAAWIAILLGSASAAQAAPPPSAEGKKLVVVLRLLGVEGARQLLTADRALVLSQRVKGVLQESLREQYSVLSYADEQLQALATANGKDLTQCSEDSCISIARTVSADFVVSGELVEFGDSTELTLRLQDVRTKESRRESAQKLRKNPTLDEIASAIDLAASELALELKTPGAVMEETTGLLALYVDPGDATISIDGRPDEAAVAGRLSRVLPLGKHSVRVRKPGFQEQSTPAFIEAGHPQTIALTLMRLPPPAAVTSKTAYLGVDSEPRDARIFIDGKDTEKRTPASFDSLAPGEHELVLEKELYLPYRETVVLKEGEFPSAVRRLRKNFGSLIVRTEPPGATVFLDDAEQPQRTPLRLESLQARAYRLRFSLPRYQPFATNVVIAPEEESTVDAPLAPRFGTLVIRSEPPGANVYLDGDQRPGQTPLTLEGIDLGSHSLRLTKPLYADLQQSVTIESGKKTEVALSLDAKFGTLRVTAESGGAPLAGAEVFLDGTKAGVTPYEDLAAKEGTVLIEVRALMHRTFEATAQVQRQVPAVVAAQLFNEYGTLSITSTPPARLLVDGKELGQADGHALPLRMGRHELALEPLEPGHYQPYSDAIIVEPGKSATLARTLAPRLGGAIILSLPPGATVLRDKEELGITPLKVSDWFAGDYALRLEKERYSPGLVKLHIEEGQTRRVEVTLLSVDLVKYGAEQRASAQQHAIYATEGAAVLAGGAGLLYGLARHSAADAQTALQSYSNATDPALIAQDRAAMTSANSRAIRERNVSIAVAAAAALGVGFAIYEWLAVPAAAESNGAQP